MLHCGILPHHDRWAKFLGRLRYVVVDELHAFRGIFGSHVAHLLRRLRRLANHYGADPPFVCCSATIGQPERLASAATSLGSIAAVTLTDLWLMLGLAVVILGLGLGLRPALFVLSHDDEFARASGLPVRLLNIMVAVLAALTVSVAMRVVGVLLVSAVMIVPVGAAQLLTRSFRATALAMGIGVAVSVAGLSITFVYPVSPGATIVVLAIGVYVVVSLIHPMIGRRRPPADPHPDMQDDVELHEAP